MIAKNIVAYREANGRFTDRRQLLKVPKLGPKAFEQCAGFMRINQGDNPLDRTSVHPESYEAAKELLAKQGFTAEDLEKGNLSELPATIRDYKKLAEELGIGEITLRDIIKELEKPARDHREDMPAPILRSDVLDMKDLKPGMILKGTVRNVIDFGVFVDIGVHQDGWCTSPSSGRAAGCSTPPRCARGRHRHRLGTGGGREEKADFPHHEEAKG